ncbi:MAG: putative membrane protein YdjX (TVP38/TMEM64 family) [Verrucomicrobiales bacterium]|jgi:uncharacterized membrane protein YdjX (TVP38/TMEM64 family)
MSSESPLPNPEAQSIDTSQPEKGRNGKLKKVLLLVGVAAVIAAAAYFFDLSAITERLVAAREQLGFWFPLLFITIYIIATVLFIPASALTLLAGGMFGVGMGSVYVSIASTLGATVAFLLGRHTLRRFIKRKIEGSAKFSAIDDAVANEGWKIVGLTRLSPAFPFALLNYAYGLTKVSLRDYVIASWIGMMPGTVLYVYLGAIGKAAADSQGRTPGEWALLAVGLAATAAVTIYVTKVARRALNSRLKDSDSTENSELSTENA